jgi:hypothetical protein
MGFGQHDPHYLGQHDPHYLGQHDPHCPGMGGVRILVQIGGRGSGFMVRLGGGQLVSPGNWPMTLLRRLVSGELPRTDLR